MQDGGIIENLHLRFMQTPKLYNCYIYVVIIIFLNILVIF